MVTGSTSCKYCTREHAGDDEKGNRGWKVGIWKEKKDKGGKSITPI